MPISVSPFAYILLAALLVGCSNPGVIKLSQNTYMISKQDHAGIFGNPASFKADIIQEAHDFAEKQGKVAVPLSSKETPAAPGRFLQFEYQFRLVDADSPDANSDKFLKPRADILIEHKFGSTTLPKSTPGKDVYTQLLKLDDLRSRGILTDAEFTRAKEKLLSEH